MTIRDCIELMRANGFSDLQHLDQGPTSWRLRLLCNADKVVIDVAHEAGVTTVTCDDPMGQRVRARVEALLPQTNPTPTTQPKRRRKNGSQENHG